MWKLFQLAIFIAVVGSNIQYQWTPNPYLAAICGALAAWLATKTLSGFFWLWVNYRPIMFPATVVLLITLWLLR